MLAAIITGTRTSRDSSARTCIDDHELAGEVEVRLLAEVQQVVAGRVLRVEVVPACGADLKKM